MRVQIYPHDTTDSIVTTVKNFYGLYSSPTSSKGVSFEDEQGNTLIARHENFRNNMIVYVRVIEEPAQPSAPASASFVTASYQPAPSGPQAYYNNGEGAPHQSPPQRIDEDISRPPSRTSRRRSLSPGNASGRRSVSVSANPIAGKPARPRPSKSRNAGSQNGADGYDSPTGYSSGDGAPGSSSGKAKDQIGNTEISVENIVEGGRRKRAKFESSVSFFPLFFFAFPFTFSPIPLLSDHTLFFPITFLSFGLTSVLCPRAACPFIYLSFLIHPYLCTFLP